MHIAVVAASAPSHMHPHLAVVRELVQRGHRVSYLVSSHLADLARTTGADVVGCTSVLPGAPGGPAEWSGDDVAGMRLFLDEAIHALPRLHRALDADRPDIVLYDIGGMAGPTSPGYQAYRTAFDDWLAQTRTCLVMIPRAMQPHAEKVGDRYRFVGPCIDPRREDPGDWAAPPGDGPLALLAFGTAYTDRIDVYRNVIDAPDGTGWRLVIATGRVAPDRFGAVPDWVQLRERVPSITAFQVANWLLSAIP